MIRQPPRSTQSRSSAASDVYKRQVQDVELEEIYEQEKIIRIYCPAEEPVPDHITEVEPIEY